MKKSNPARGNLKFKQLSLRSETIRILTERELTLVRAGNCLEGSVVTQDAAMALAGAC